MTERALAVEVILSTTAVTARQLGQGRAPLPGQYAASLAVFGVLSAVSRIAEPLSHFAALFGGLVVLAQYVNPNGPGRWLVKALSSSAASSSAGPQLASVETGESAAALAAIVGGPAGGTTGATTAPPTPSGGYPLAGLA